jgi:hypothetical protein
VNTGIENVNTSALSVYPNPVIDGTLYVKGVSAGEKIEIFGISGSSKGVYTATGSATVIDFSRYASGAYIVRAGGKTAKVMKR